MHIRRLLLRDFRCCEHVDLHPSPGVNIFVGPNAQGKSTLLEAVYLLATTRSHRALRDQEMIRWGQNQAFASAEVVRERKGEVNIEIGLSRTERRVTRINQVRRSHVPDLVGHLNAVIFCADDLAIVRGEPAVRRRFLNLEISQLSPRYCFALVQYRRVLEQRNRLLRFIRDTGQNADTLAVWDEKLIETGAPLIERRQGFVSDLTNCVAPIHARLSGDAERLEVVYKPSFPLEKPASVVEAFRAFLAPLRSREVACGNTLLGPHRDDVVFLVNGADARVFGSQGQHRSIALATKLAEVELMRRQVGEPPVLLLDDAASELDQTRRTCLFSLMSGNCQTFLTCTGTEGIPKEILQQASLHWVQEGKVLPMAPITP